MLKLPKLNYVKKQTMFSEMLMSRLTRIKRIFKTCLLNSRIPSLFLLRETRTSNTPSRELPEVVEKLLNILKETSKIRLMDTLKQFKSNMKEIWTIFTEKLVCLEVNSNNSMIRVVVLIFLMKSTNSLLNSTTMKRR